MPIKIRKGDMVQVIAGDDRGKTGRVLSVDAAKNRVIVEKVNFVKRHTKARRQGQAGGIIDPGSKFIEIGRRRLRLCFGEADEDKGQQKQHLP
jgi:ribosomal protein L24